MDASFIVDVLLNFRTAFIEDDHLVTDTARIAVHYLKVRIHCTFNSALTSITTVYVAHREGKD